MYACTDPTPNLLGTNRCYDNINVLIQKSSSTAGFNPVHAPDLAPV